MLFASLEEITTFNRGAVRQDGNVKGLAPFMIGGSPMPPDVVFRRRPRHSGGGVVPQVFETGILKYSTSPRAGSTKSCAVVSASSNSR